MKKLGEEVGTAPVSTSTPAPEHVDPAASAEEPPAVELPTGLGRALAFLQDRGLLGGDSPQAVEPATPAGTTIPPTEAPVIPAGQASTPPGATNPPAETPPPAPVAQPSNGAKGEPEPDLNLFLDDYNDENMKELEQTILNELAPYPALQEAFSSDKDWHAAIIKWIIEHPDAKDADYLKYFSQQDEIASIEAKDKEKKKAKAKTGGTTALATVPVAGQVIEMQEPEGVGDSGAKAKRDRVQKAREKVSKLETIRADFMDKQRKKFMDLFGDAYKNRKAAFGTEDGWHMYSADRDLKLRWQLHRGVKKKEKPHKTVVDKNIVITPAPLHKAIGQDAMKVPFNGFDVENSRCDKIVTLMITTLQSKKDETTAVHLLNYSKFFKGLVRSDAEKMRSDSAWYSVVEAIVKGNAEVAERTKTALDAADYAKIEDKHNEARRAKADIQDVATFDVDAADSAGQYRSVKSVVMTQMWRTMFIITLVLLPVMFLAGLFMFR